MTKASALPQPSFLAIGLGVIPRTLFPPAVLPALADDVGSHGVDSTTPTTLGLVPEDVALPRTENAEHMRLLHWQRPAPSAFQYMHHNMHSTITRYADIYTMMIVRGPAVAVAMRLS